MIVPVSSTVDEDLDIVQKQGQSFFNNHFVDSRESSKRNHNLYYKSHMEGILATPEYRNLSHSSFIEKRKNLRTQYQTLDSSQAKEQRTRSTHLSRFPNTIYKNSFEAKSYKSRILDQIEQPYLDLEHNNKKHRENLEQI